MIGRLAFEKLTNARRRVSPLLGLPSRMTAGWLRGVLDSGGATSALLDSDKHRHLNPRLRLGNRRRKPLISGRSND